MSSFLTSLYDMYENFASEHKSTHTDINESLFLRRVLFALFRTERQHLAFKVSLGVTSENIKKTRRHIVLVV